MDNLRVLSSDETLIDGRQIQSLVGPPNNISFIEHVVFRGIRCVGAEVDGEWYLVGGRTSDEQALGGPVGPYTFEGLCALIRFLPVWTR